MHKLSVIACSFALAGMVAGAQTLSERAPEQGFAFEASLDLKSAHVWRGYVANDRPVWQPSGTVSYDTVEFGKLGASVWANFDFSDRNRRLSKAGLGGIDYNLFYAVDVEDLELEIGHTWYTYRKVIVPRHESTREVYAKAAINNDIVKPFVGVHYDYAAVNKGWYLNAGLNKEVGINDQLAVGAESAIGWGDDDYMGYYFNSGGSGFADLENSVYAKYALTDHVSVGARLAWMVLLDNDARDKSAYRTAGSWDKGIVYGGVNLSVEF